MINFCFSSADINVTDWSLVVITAILVFNKNIRLILLM